MNADEAFRYRGLSEIMAQTRDAQKTHKGDMHMHDVDVVLQQVVVTESRRVPVNVNGQPRAYTVDETGTSTTFALEYPLTITVEAEAGTPAAVRELLGKLQETVGASVSVIAQRKMQAGFHINAPEGE